MKNQFLKYEKMFVVGLYKMERHPVRKAKTLGRFSSCSKMPRDASYGVEFAGKILRFFS